MVTLRATVIMKTDIGGSTARFRALPESDLSAVLAAHRQLVSRIAATHAGHIVKPEGDAFWLVFPSVTAASLAPVSALEELGFSQPGNGDDRLAMRIVITLGDVLREEETLVGDAVVLAARIESLTPPDEICLALGAWLAVNKGGGPHVLCGCVPVEGVRRARAGLPGRPDSPDAHRREPVHRRRGSAWLRGPHRVALG